MLKTRTFAKSAFFAGIVLVGLLLNGCGGSDGYADSDTYNISVAENTKVNIDLVTGAKILDADVEEYIFSGTDVFYVKQMPENGNATLKKVALLSYTPDANYTGEDSIYVEQNKEDSNGDDGNFRQIYIRLTVTDVPSAPTISGDPDTLIGSGGNYYFKPIAYDGDDDVLTFSISNKPSWITFNTATGEMSGVAPAYDEIYTGIKVSVTDGQSIVSLPAFDLTVENRNHAPEISGIPTSSVAVGDTYYFKPIARDIDGDTLTFHIANKPMWADFNTSTGEITGTVDTSHMEIKDMTVYVDDGYETAYLDPVTVVVEENE